MVCATDKTTYASFPALIAALIRLQSSFVAAFPKEACTWICISWWAAAIAGTTKPGVLSSKPDHKFGMHSSEVYLHVFLTQQQENILKEEATFSELQV